jgi:hypothetical protein
MELNLKQRLFAVFVYLIIIISIGIYFSGDWSFFIDTNSNLNVVLIATGLTLLLGSYISEPYYSKPIDALTRWLALMLFVEGLDSKNCLMFYPFWKFAAISMGSVSLFLIVLYGYLPKYEKYQKAAVDIVCKISRPEYVFSLLYFDIVISFFGQYSPELPFLIGFGFLLLINKPIVWLTKYAWRVFDFIKKKDSKNFLGSVIGHESLDFFKVEITSNILNHHSTLEGKLVIKQLDRKGVLGVIVDERYLLNKRWAYIFLLRKQDGNYLTVDKESLDLLAGEKTIFSKTNQVDLLMDERLPEELKDSLLQNDIYKNYKNIIGYVWTGSTINQIKFHCLFNVDFLKERGVGEGTIVLAKIGDQAVLYQIIDARTNEESLEHQDSHGFTVGTAQKLGRYDAGASELNTVKWLPEIYTPLFLLNQDEGVYDPANFIGRLPKTNYGIPIKSPNELVTHNSAILGILGIGKSCLTFELLKKLIDSTNVKIFCVDITNQYLRELAKYVDPNLIQDDIPQASKTNLRNTNPNGNADNPDSWGNEILYRTTLNTDLNAFFQSAGRIMVINPDMHVISKAGSQFRIQHKVDLTASEKTRVITEELFKLAKAAGETLEARMLVVLEEAHSLVPEWNSVANDGDKNATNGIAKVILQGRKYGFGSMVIAQRTANISKSILNQCNTVFALRVFDDTGKQFLENYIGSDYSNLLPVLEERHAIAIGKALSLKQPVIIELNDRNHIIQNQPQP